MLRLGGLVGLQALAGRTAAAPLNEGDSAGANAFAIKGETLDTTFGKEGAIELREFAVGMENTLSIGSSSSGAGAGKTTFKELIVRKVIDSATPLFIKAIGTGVHWQGVKLYVRRSGGVNPASSGAKGSFLLYEFNLIAPKSTDWQIGKDGELEETIVFEFGELRVSYYRQSPTGALESRPVIGT